MESINAGKNNGMWKGNQVGYGALHAWIKRHKPKPKVCEICKIKEPYDLANISGEYKRNVNDFQWVCRSCHMKLDGRVQKLRHTKLTEINILTILGLYENGNLSIGAIMKMFSVNRKTIYRILHGKTWRCLF